MDRVNGADWVDIGGGRRGYRSQNLAAGIDGTEVTSSWLNAVQENLLKVIEAAGLEPNIADWNLLWKALQIGSGGRADIPVNGWQSAPPGAPAEGDRYVVKPAGTGAWAGQDGKIAMWIGGAWAYAAPVAGLQVQYWSGRQIVLRYDGAAWAEWLASETAAGPVQLATGAKAREGADATRAVTSTALWEAIRSGHYATVSGSANILTATLSPPITAYYPGLVVALILAAENNGPATLNLNGLGAKDIRPVRANTTFVGGEMKANHVAWFVYTGSLFVLLNPCASENAVGMVERATLTQALAGMDFERYITAAVLKALLATPREDAAANFQNFKTSTRTVLAGLMPTVFTATVNKKDAASTIVLDGSISIHNDSTGFGLWVAEISMAGQTIRTAIFGSADSAGGVTVCPISAAFAGIAAGNHTLTIKAGRSTSASMNFVVNPNSTDESAYGTGTESVLAAYEVI